MAFDLYPELRSSSWLERGETVKVYQEHRAQELTEILWRHPESPWYQRIELHGRRIDGHISNAAFIRTLTSSFVRRWKDEGRIGGLFGSVDKDGKERVIRWSRLQQAAFLIYIWRKISEVVSKGRAEWILGCIDDFSDASQEKKKLLESESLPAAFAGPDTLIAADQGVRAIMVVFNALLSVAYSDIDLENWEIIKVSEDDSNRYVSDALEDVRRHRKISDFLSEVCECLFNSSFDWRMGSAKSIADPDMRQLQMAYKGSSGYSLLQNNILKHLGENGSERIKDYIKVVKDRMGK